MSTSKRIGALPAIAAVLAGAIAATVLVWIAYANGYDSFARGMIQGAAGTIAILAALWFLGGRAGGPGRLVTGAGDERDKTLALKASADAGFGMLLGALGGTVAGMYGTPGPLVGGIVLWAGLIAGLGSYAVRSFRE